MNDNSWLAARRLLAVRLDNLGDVLVTTPAIHAIRESLPGAHITLLASPVGAQMGCLNPDIDDVIVYRAPWMDPWKTLPQDSEREQSVIRTLKDRAFDAAIIFSSFRQSPLPAAYLCYLADIPLRLAASIDGPGSLLTARHRHPETMRHEVERGLDLVGAVGFGTSDLDLVLQVPDEERAHAAELVARASGFRPRAGRLMATGGPLVAVHPGCSMPARTYPWELYAEVADLLVEKLGATVALTGAKDEWDLVAGVSERMRHPALDLAGLLSFPTLCALLSIADLVVTNNTGPMHLAAAVKTPVIALFALTNPPEQWGPWRVPHRQLYHEVPCRLCYSRVCPYHQECLRLVTPPAVVAAAQDLLAEVAAGPAASAGATHVGAGRPLGAARPRVRNDVSHHP